MRYRIQRHRVLVRLQSYQHCQGLRLQSSRLRFLLHCLVRSKVRLGVVESPSLIRQLLPALSRSTLPVVEAALPSTWLGDVECTVGVIKRPALSMSTLPVVEAALPSTWLGDVESTLGVIETPTLNLRTSCLMRSFRRIVVAGAGTCEETRISSNRIAIAGSKNLCTEVINNTNSSHNACK